VRLFKTYVFYPFSLPPGTFQRLSGMGLGAPGGDPWFRVSPPIVQNTPETYAEFTYFHSHARDLLFGLDAQDRSLLVYQVGDDRIAGWTFRIEIPKRPGAEAAVSRVLKLTDVQAMIYDLDVGVLSFAVMWDRREAEAQGLSADVSFGDVLDINNLFRRRAPSFLDFHEVKQSLVSKDHRPGDGWAAFQKSKRELPVEIEIREASGESGPDRRENFGDRFDRVFGTRQRLPYIANHFLFWLARLGNDLGIPTEKMEPILDERNFVFSLVVADQEDRGLDSPSPPDPEPVVDPENVFGKLTEEPEGFRESLARLLFVDPAGGGYVANHDLRDRMLAKALYLRYRDYGTYYGFTRYSGVFLLHGGGGEEFARDALLGQFDSMYFQMANLLLVLRAALLDLSHRSALISRRLRSPDDLDNPELNKDIERIRSDFLRFHTKYWFCEVTAQEQGIEMFDLWNRNMGNERLFAEVDQQVRALHDFSQATVNRRLGRLTYLNISAIGVALIGLMVGALTISTSAAWGYIGIAILVSFVLGAIAAYLLFAAGPKVLCWLERCRTPRWISARRGPRR